MEGGCSRALLHFCHSCPGIHRGKLQQESRASFVMPMPGFPFAPAYRRQAGMTGSGLSDES